MNDLNTINCLFLDIGGVLLSNGWDHNFRQQAVDYFHLDGEKMDERHSILFPQFEEGKISLDDYLDGVVFYTKRDFTHTDFKDFIYSLSTPNSEMIALIKNLKLKYGLKVIAVSNEGREINAFRINKFKLNKVFDFFVSSCFVHIRKPDPAIFQLAIDCTQVPLNNIVYIDDIQQYADLATEMGIRSIHHTDYLTTSKALADLGLTIDQERTENDYQNSEESK